MLYGGCLFLFNCMMIMCELYYLRRCLLRFYVCVDFEVYHDYIMILELFVVVLRIVLIILCVCIS